ncbi:MAG: PQQ-dependent sugar dehydrogenase [Spirochaetia bacterium]|nr:PQQ-dependent sugar dehydrogenase [Spirochaetia bacterium]
MKNNLLQSLKNTPQKKTIIPALFFLGLIFFFHSIFPSPDPVKEIKLRPIRKDFQKPVHAVFPKKQSDLYYVVEQNGRIIRIENHKRNVFLDISGKVSSGYELGLLSMAVKKTFSEKKGDVFYINYTTKNPIHTVIAEIPLQIHHSGNVTGNFSKKRILLKFAQPYSNHNGGMMAFGHDGNLYISSGDGGSAGDPKNYAQNPRSLLGKILRINPSKKSSMKYSLPEDAPVIKGALPEIYAMGLRNPWRFSFDKKNGFLYAGDVGQNKIEEIDLIEKGKNYGWNPMEGNLCYKQKNCRKNRYTSPIHTYGRNDGISVTGGYVYRGKKIPALFGTYLFADYGSGNIWSLPLAANGRNSGPAVKIFSNAGRISSFAEDGGGELYILDHSKGILYAIENDMR